MASINDLAKEYSDYLRLNKNNPSAINEIASRIKGLVYTSSKKPLSQEDTEKLISEIQSVLSSPKKTKDGYLIVEAEDSSELIKLIQMLRKQTGGR